MVRRKGKVRVICKADPKHKQVQGLAVAAAGEGRRRASDDTNDAPDPRGV